MYAVLRVEEMAKSFEFMSNSDVFGAYVKQYVDFEQAELDVLWSKSAQRTYLKNQYLVQQGDLCNSVSFIISGCTRTFYADGDGQEHIVSFAIENWWTADLGSFITQSPADYNVQCIEATRVVQFSYANLEELYQEVPKMERLFRMIVERAYVASQKRLIQNYSLEAKERYVNFVNQYPEITRRVPQYMIASYLGITKEFLSKIKSQLAQST